MRIFGCDIGKLRKSPDPPGESARSVLTPMGTPVSQAFSVLGGTEADPIRHTLAVIDTVHGDGSLPPLIAKQEVLDRLNGKFVAGKGIVIHSRSQIPEFTTAHVSGTGKIDLQNLILLTHLTQPSYLGYPHGTGP